MRRFGIPEIALGALLAVAIFAVGASVQIINPKNYGGEAKPGENAAPISATKPAQEAEAEINKRIADYNGALDALTFCLVIANIALWWVTWRSSVNQSRDMKESIAIARESADAAIRATENAETALRRLETSHVYPIEMQYLTVAQGGTPLQYKAAWVSLKFKNYGRSPAILRGAWIRVSITRQGQQTPIYGTGRIFLGVDGATIGEGEISESVTCANMTGIVPYAGETSAGAAQLKLFVHVAWDDVMGASYGRGTWYVWNNSARKFNRTGAATVAD